MDTIQFVKCPECGRETHGRKVSELAGEEFDRIKEEGGELSSTIGRRRCWVYYPSKHRGPDGKDCPGCKKASKLEERRVPPSFRRKVVKREPYQTPSHPNGTESVLITLECGHTVGYKGSREPKRFVICKQCQEIWEANA